MLGSKNHFPVQQYILNFMDIKQVIGISTINKNVLNAIRQSSALQGKIYALYNGMEFSSPIWPDRYINLVNLQERKKKLEFTCLHSFDIDRDDIDMSLDDGKLVTEKGYGLDRVEYGLNGEQVFRDGIEPFVCRLMMGEEDILEVRMTSIDETTLEIASTMKTRTRLSDSTDFSRDGHFSTQTFTIETGLNRVTIRHVQVALNGKILISYRSTKGWETILFDPKENHIMGIIEHYHDRFQGDCCVIRRSDFLLISCAPLDNSSMEIYSWKEILSSPPIPSEDGRFNLKNVQRIPNLKVLYPNISSFHPKGKKSIERYEPMQGYELFKIPDGILFVQMYNQAYAESKMILVVLSISLDGIKSQDLLDSLNMDLDVFSWDEQLHGTQYYLPFQSKMVSYNPPLRNMATMFGNCFVWVSRLDRIDETQVDLFLTVLDFGRQEKCLDGVQGVRRVLEPTQEARSDPKFVKVTQEDYTPRVLETRGNGPKSVENVFRFRLDDFPLTNRPVKITSLVSDDVTLLFAISYLSPEDEIQENNEIESDDGSRFSSDFDSEYEGYRPERFKTRCWVFDFADRNVG